MAQRTNENGTAADIAIIGGGPGGLTAAIALARRGIRSTVFERDGHPQDMPRFNPDRSYPIDLTGHGLKAVRHIDAVAHFDAHMTPFHGIRNRGRIFDPWSEPGWIGSRGDIMRALMSLVEERHRDLIDVAFQRDIRADDVDVHAGKVAGQTFDLVIGSDGAGSAVRKAMQDQVEGFTVETSAVPNYGLILELDQVGDTLDRHYLQGLALSPLTLAGVTIDESMPDGVRWICVVGVNKPHTFASAEEATSWLRRNVPRALELTSEQAVVEFSRRKVVHLGQRLTCSQLHGGRAVLLGDAAASFPPIGQGGNAALESAMVFDQALASGPLATTGARFEEAWKPETDALTWISSQIRYQSPWMMARLAISRVLGVKPINDAKSSIRSYSEVRRSARRLGPLWAATPGTDETMNRQVGNRLQRVEAPAVVPDMRGRVALVTGASDGVGRSVAARLAATGAVTLITARNRAKGERVRDEIVQTTGNKGVHVVDLDLADLASVRQAAATVLDHWDQLDLLLCIAGYAGRGTRTETADGFETTFGVNHLGHALLARLLTDRLREGAPSRIVLVASEAHRRAKGGLDFDDLMMAQGEFQPLLAYNRSKLANILYTRELARRLAGSGVDVSAAHPGAVDTPMLQSLFGRPVLRHLYPLLRRGLISPDEAAAGLLRVALDSTLTGRTGLYYERGQLAEPGAVGLDDDSARRLWSVTEELIGLESADR